MKLSKLLWQENISYSAPSGQDQSPTAAAQKSKGWGCGSGPTSYVRGLRSSLHSQSRSYTPTSCTGHSGIWCMLSHREILEKLLQYRKCLTQFTKRWETMENALNKKQMCLKMSYIRKCKDLHSVWTKFRTQL